jgi:hypothetical protein
VRLPVVFFILFLLVINAVAHFLPFERSSLAPDDYYYLRWMKEVNPTHLSDYFKISPDRPIAHMLINGLFKVVQDNSQLSLIYIFLVSSFNLLLVFFIFKALFNNLSLAFIGSLIFCLMPNMLEVYHTFTYAFPATHIGVYLASFLFYLYFNKKKKIIYLVFSLATYTAGLLAYEVGFFLPVIFLAYNILYLKESPKKHLLYFTIPAFFYALLRLSSALSFSGVSTAAIPRQIAFSLSPFIDLFHQYLGRYMMRNILYGIYKFFDMDLSLRLFIIFMDIIIVASLFFLLKKVNLEKVSKRLLIFAFWVFSAFLLPIALYGSGVGGRHLVLPSIGFVIFLIWLLERTGRYWRLTFLAFVSLALIICQGNAWIQVIACRINGAIYETMKEKKSQLLAAGNIVIDTKSFADNIDFTWKITEHNVLNTYYGAQAFEEWMFENMAKLITGDNNKAVYAAIGSVISEDGWLKFEIAGEREYRRILKKTVILPAQGSVIIDFKTVYNKGFKNGLRI